MKSILYKLFILVVGMIAIQSCGGEDPESTPVKTPEELAIEALTGDGMQAWGIDGGGSVERDGAVITDNYAEFELVMSSTSSKLYTSKNNNDLFDSAGTWSFAGTNFDKFILSGTKPAADREISFTQAGENLKLTFTIPAPGARINGIHAVAGSYTFNLIKQ
tara:strand:+ start:244 stop:729 length:486 start_codon:yes stop_codon:yes gene_type:complete